MKLYKVLFLTAFFIQSTLLYANKFEYSGSCKLNADIYAFEDCLSKELAECDKQLNALYGKLFKKSHDGALIKSEALWIKFKEADCVFMASAVNEGKYFQSIEKACLINKTNARIADLKRSFLYSKWVDIS